MDIKLIVTGSRPWEYWVRHWGLSFVIDGTILYDTFNNYPVLEKKLRKARVDVNAIDTVVISHNHWDHIGGLWSFLEKHPHVSVYLPTRAEKDVKEKVVTSGARIMSAPGIKTLKENILLSDDMVCAFHGKTLAEHYIAVKSPQGLTLIVGCAHPGIAAMTRHAAETFQMPVYGVIGGFHLFKSDIEAAHQCANELKNLGVQMVAPTHCTGWRAERVFKRAFEQGFVALREGKIISL